MSVAGLLSDSMLDHTHIPRVERGPRRHSMNLIDSLGPLLLIVLPGSNIRLPILLHLLHGLHDPFTLWFDDAGTVTIRCRCMRVRPA